MTRHASMIAADLPAAGIHTVTAPYDGQVIAEVETGDRRHVEAALAAAEAQFRDRDAWLPVHERVAVLERVAGLIPGMSAASVSRRHDSPLSMGTNITPPKSLSS